MRTPTRTQFENFTRRVAELNGVANVANTFTVQPTVQQTVEKRIQESSAFLSAINMTPVSELSAQKVGIGVSGTIAGRTDTSGNNKRMPRDVTDLDSNTYTCAKTDFDTAVPYARLDAWAHQPHFQVALRDSIITQQGLDRLMIGFNGTHVARNTDRQAFPLLEDVNIGWLQQYRDHAAQRVLSTGKSEGVIQIGGTEADYANLDALVMDAVANLIEPWHRQHPGLVAILGRDLIHDKYFPLVNQTQPASEQLAADTLLGRKRVGGLPPADVPFMPSNAILITSLSNLSLYWQIGGRRRHLREEPEYDRIANYESSNDAYVVEDFGMGCLIENIQIGDAAHG